MAKFLKALEMIVFIAIAIGGAFLFFKTDIAYQYPKLRRLFLALILGNIFTYFTKYFARDGIMKGSIPTKFDFAGIKFDLKNLIENFEFAISAKLIMFIALSYLFYLNIDKQIEPIYSSILDKECKNDSTRIRIAIIYNDFDYTRVIKAAFINSVNQLLKENVDCIDIIERVGPNQGLNQPGISDEYNRLADNLLKREIDIDYFVMIGTTPSEAMNNYFKSKSMKPKIIFLGVSDPQSSKLVSTNTPVVGRHDQNEIAGVAYCGDPIIIPQQLRSIFPNKTIRYSYSKTQPQDVYFKNKFVDSDLYFRNELVIDSINQETVKREYFADQNFETFSWMTIESLFENRFEVLKGLNNIISTTASHPFYKLTPIAISVSDLEIGAFGAEILKKSYVDKVDLGDIPVKIPDWKLFYSKSLCETGGITIPQARNSQMKIVEFE